MAFNSANDFIAIQRGATDSVLGRMPPLDLLVQLLSESGLITVVVSDTAPVTNQDITAWFDPNNPSYTTQGQLMLWNGAAYVAATQTLFAQMLANTAGLAQNDMLVGAGIPAAGVGSDGDWYSRTDAPGGLFYKVAGAWSYAVSSNTQPTVQIGVADEL